MKAKQTKEKKKIFSIKYKLMIVFGLLATISTATISFFAITIAKDVAIEKVEKHLIDEAKDTAELIDARLDSFFQYLTGLTEIPFLYDNNISFQEKADRLQNIIDNRKLKMMMSIGDTNGVLYTRGYKPVNLSKQDWFSTAMSGKRYISEPFISALNGSLIFVIALPIYNKQKKIVSILNVAMDGFWLSNQIKDIAVGKTGSAYIIDKHETVIAHKSQKLVKNQANASKKVKNNPKLKSLVAFEKKALASNKSSIGFYEYEGVDKIASFSKIKSTGWTVIIGAPKKEFLDSIARLEMILISLGLGIFGGVLITTILVARKMVKPVVGTTTFIEEIASGDLTSKLDEKYTSTNDEIGLIADAIQGLQYRLIDIIRAIKTISTELAASSEETSATTQTFSENAQSQAAALEQINATLEEITAGADSIKDNTNSQIKSMETVAQGIKFLKGVEKNIKGSVEYLADQSQEISGQTQESNSLLLTMQEQSSEISKSSEQMLNIVKVINDVADQINLLSLNAAIESARAGEAGRGFAVVADEISKLADETQSNVKSIEASIMENNTKIKQGEEIVNQSIAKLQIVTQGVLGMAESVQGVDSEIDGQTKQSDNLNSNIVEVKEKSESIQTGIQEMNIALGEITGSVSNVNQTVQATASGSEEVAGGAEQVAKMSQQLQEKVDFFKIPE